MPDPIRLERTPHDEAEELLPWYATGQLDAADRAIVDHHLASCAACRRQLAMDHRLIEEFQGLAPEVESGWARLRDSIERRQRPRQWLADFWANLENAFRQPAVAALAAAQLAFVVFAAGLFMWLSRPTYQALGSASPPASANVILIFRADATEHEMRSALTSAGASVVGGPTSAGAYLLHVNATRRQQALASLQSDDEVQMAEPIDGASQ